MALELAPTAAETRQSAEAGELDDVAPGTAVGRFMLLAKLGAGGMGVVFAAYDPELDRKVALKLLRPRADGRHDREGRTRLLREAQALARLSHPNVVAVHDVGVHGDRVWLAMELVAGQTLREWATATPRRWPEILRVLTDAARGVAAAHAAGLVYRDLKPDNVMVGNDDRVRVMDFGLARATAADERSSVSTTPIPSDPSPSLETIQGTPAYMAPEQWLGSAGEAAIDQFGWSVMAWELLYGARPFAGDTRDVLARRVIAGQREPPPRGRRVPGWLRRIVDRAMAHERRERWPTMAALVAALERGRTQARLRLAALALVGVAVLAAGLEGVRRWDLARRVADCEATGAALDTVWHDLARLRLHTAFVTTGVPHAGATADRVVPWLDAQAAAWRQARTDVRLNADIRGVWDADIVTRAVWCLEDRQMELDALIAEFGDPGPTTVQKAIGAAVGLRSVVPCMDRSLLLRQPAPPTAGRDALRAVRARLSRAYSLRLAGNYEVALAVATAARQTDEALAWPPLWAAARAHEGELLEKTGAYVEAEAASKEAYFAAARGDAWEVAASAASKLVYTIGYKQARHDDGRTWARHAAMAIDRTGDHTGLLEAKRLNNLATVHEAAGDLVDARATFEQALAILERVLGRDHPNVAVALSNIANIHNTTGDHSAAHPLLERALAITQRTLGPDHPDVAIDLNNLANAYQVMGAFAEARELHERALAIRERALGPDHPDLAFSLHNLAVVEIAAGDPARALALDGRALVLFETALGRDHPHVAVVLTNLAEAHVAAGTHAQARPLLERARTIFAAVHGLDDPTVAATLASLGRVDLAEDRPLAALPLLERAVAVFAAHPGVQEAEFEATFALAVALFAADRARARALAIQARDGHREAGPRKARQLAEVEQWLAEHPGDE